MRSVSLLVAAAAVTSAAGCVDMCNGTVYLNGDVYSVAFGVIDDKGVATGAYIDLLAAGETSGFGQLNINTNILYNDTTQMYALGYLGA